MVSFLYYKIDVFQIQLSQTPILSLSFHFPLIIFLVYLIKMIKSSETDSVYKMSQKLDRDNDIPSTEEFIKRFNVLFI